MRHQDIIVIGAGGLQAGFYAAGECTGMGGREKALVEGAIAGHAAIGNHDAVRALWPQRARWQRFADAVQRSFALPASLKQLPRHDTLAAADGGLGFKP